MQPYQQRVVEEKAELDAKISRLEAFLNDNTNVLSLQVDEHSRLLQQATVMREYSRILGLRIAEFK
jgi:hypothetical protein